MEGLLGTGAAIAARHLVRFRKGGFVPPLLMPCVLLAAIAGGLSAVSSTPGFGYPNYTSFVFVFVLFVGAAYGGVFLAAEFTADLEGNFLSRMMLATRRHTVIIFGLLVASVAEGLFIIAVLFGIGLIAGMDVSGSVPEILALVTLALLLNVAAALWGIGLAFRLRSAQAASLMLLPTLALLFTGPVYVPRHLLTGWLKTAASVNPLTPLMEAGRGLLVHAPVHMGLAFACAVGLIAVFYPFALTGLRKVERQPGGHS